jgi:hypothetical protein
MATRHRLGWNLLICVALHICREKSPAERARGLASLPPCARLARSQMLYTVQHRSYEATQAANQPVLPRRLR